MEDALISPAGFMILSGAGLVEASATNKIKVHTTEQTDKVTVDEEANTVTISLTSKPYTAAGEDLIYVMRMDNGEVDSEPYIPNHDSIKAVDVDGNVTEVEEEIAGYEIELIGAANAKPERAGADDLSAFQYGDIVLVDYYVEKTGDAQQIEITPDKFGGNYYLEASTLFRTTDGVDMPAEFIIPNCKIQSNFTFTMASSGDPSTFTFTMDAFPDYTRFDKTKKVLAAIQIIDAGNAEEVRTRTRTTHDPEHEKYLG
jgi:hypothetical protein